MVQGSPKGPLDTFRSLKVQNTFIMQYYLLFSVIVMNIKWNFSKAMILYKEKCQHPENLPNTMNKYKSDVTQYKKFIDYGFRYHNAKNLLRNKYHLLSFDVVLKRHI